MICTSNFSNFQLEEARQIHARFEKEFSSKNEETAQVVRKHHELLERLEEENLAKTRLTLELHKAEGEKPVGWNPGIALLRASVSTEYFKANVKVK